MKRFAITGWCQMRIRQMLAEEPETGKDVKESCSSSRRFIDATAGTGKDTLFLCDLLGESGGEILSMDIQEMALEKTEARVRLPLEMTMTKRIRMKMLPAAAWEEKNGRF